MAARFLLRSRICFFVFPKAARLHLFADPKPPPTMIVFYTPDITDDGLARFDVSESRHISQVLRKKPGDEIAFTDGRGGRYAGFLAEVHRDACTARITYAEEVPSRPFGLHLVLAPPKNSNRLEWVAEKVTELGVETISLVQCSRSERTRVRTDRLERILLAAMKQSMQAYLPRIQGLQPLEEFLRQGLSGQGFIAWCGAEKLPSLQHNYRRGADVTLLIGPEGDFTPEEVRLAEACGYEPVSLGPNRLRTETAALVACTIVNVMNQ